MLFTALSHVVMTLPGNTSYFFYTTYYDYWSDLRRQDILLRMAAICSTLNHSKNFVLFCASSADMREASVELIKILLCWDRWKKKEQRAERQWPKPTIETTLVDDDDDDDDPTTIN